jgi:hypothetical protein
MKSLAYGSSIPHIDVADLELFEVPRVSPSVEERIGDFVAKAVAGFGQADNIERALGARADVVIEKLIHATH